MEVGGKWKEKEKVLIYEAGHRIMAPEHVTLNEKCLETCKLSRKSSEAIKVWFLKFFL